MNNNRGEVRTAASVTATAGRGPRQRRHRQGVTCCRKTIEPAWLDAFEAVLRRCGLQPGDTVAVLCESQSRRVLPQLARLAVARIGCAGFILEVPSVFAPGVPVARSTGASPALQKMAPVWPRSQAARWCSTAPWKG
jgi:hypothetical protein